MNNKYDEHILHELIKKIYDQCALSMHGKHYCNLRIGERADVIDEVVRKINYYK